VRRSATLAGAAAVAPDCPPPARRCAGRAPGRPPARRGRPAQPWTAATTAAAEGRVERELLSDEDLVERARGNPGAEADACLDALYRRWYPQVARWCLRIAGDRERAAELAQEVFLRVHGRLDGFRGESRFSTWLYAVTRSVAINRGIAERRRREEPLDAESAPEPADPRPGAAEDFESAEAAAWMRSALAEALEPEEAKVLYLHYALGLTLPAITALLRLDNKSGAKAYIVSGRRKLVRRYGERGPLSAAGRTP
jgi:RNA polymerase sigma-70 factor (ECF subfamily)